MMSIIIYVDSGVRGNPSDHGAFAFFVVESPVERCLHKFGQNIPGKVTNNYAEYYGILEALKYAKETGLDDITIKSDSNLAIQQIKGHFKVKNSGLIEIQKKVIEITKGFEHIEFEWVPRTHRWIKLVDAFHNRIMDLHGK